jgi:sugar phosphate isomerase/epimerase
MTSVQSRLRLAGSTLPLPPRFCGEELPDEQLLAADLARLARAGFECIDLVDTWLSPGALNSVARVTLAEIIGVAGLQVAGISVIRKSVIDPLAGRANLDHTFASIEAAFEMSVPIVCIGFHRPLTAEQQGQWPFWAVPGPSDLRDGATYELAVERLTAICAFAEARGVTISLELYEDTLLGSGSSAAQLVRDVAAPNLGLNPDLANLWRQPRHLEETWRECLEECLPYMNYWHVKNFRRAPVWPDGPVVTFPTPLASGDIDYSTAVRLVVARGYEGPICIEHYGGDGLWEQRVARVYLSATLDEVLAERAGASGGAGVRPPSPVDA